MCLYTELARLHAVCEEVGEDAKKTSAEIHPSYRNLKGDARCDWLTAFIALHWK